MKKTILLIIICALSITSVQAMNTTNLKKFCLPTIEMIGGVGIIYLSTKQAYSYEITPNQISHTFNINFKSLLSTILGALITYKGLTAIVKRI